MTSMLGTTSDPAVCYQIFEDGMQAAEDHSLDKASACFRRVTEIRPSFVAAHVNFGSVLWAQKKSDDAARAFKRAIKLDPRTAQAHVGLAVILAEQNRFDDAVTSLRTAVAIEPTNTAYMNLGGIYRRLGKRKQAMRCYEAAVALDSADHFSRLNRGIEYLLVGRFEEGWRDFAYRLFLDYGHTHLDIYKDKRVWNGDRVDHLVIHFEQGLGDTIQAARYIDEASKHCNQLIFVPQVGLGSLMAYSFKHNPKVTVSETVPKHYDAYQWIDMLMMRAGVDPIPTAPYLSVPETKRWRHLQNLPGLKVGLVWAGRTEQVIDKRRTMAFEFTHKLFEIPGVSFVSLQRDRTEHHPKLYDVAPYLNDWKATAGAIDALDLVISVDTSVAHMAGALGKPVWLLNRFDTCWRWQLDRDDSPWYPTMRIFRQAGIGDWTSVIDQVYLALDDLQKKSNDYQSPH